MNLRVLLIDEDIYLQRNLQGLLSRAGYFVTIAGSCQEALKALGSGAPDLAILDVALPDGDGVTFCTQLRRDWTFPIIMLTAKSEVADRINGLESGADDYLTKPFSPDELLARVRAHLRRQRLNDEHRTPRSIGNLQIDVNRRDVLRNGIPVGLKNREFELFAHLAAMEGKAMSREALFTHSWGYEMSFNTNSLDVYIYRLRKKLERDPNEPEYIHTLRGFGYKLEYLPNG